MHAFRSMAVLLVLLTACATAAFDDSHGEVAAREVRGGRFHHASLGAADAPQAVADLLPLLGRELGDVADSLCADELQVVARRELTGPDGGRLIALSLQQLAAGVPIRGARLDLTLRPVAGDLLLVASSYRLYRDAGVDVQAHISREQAAALAREALRAPPDAAVSAGHLAIEPVEAELRLAWSVTLAGDHRRAIVLAGGDDAGRVILEDERRWEAGGTVHGWISRGAPGRSVSERVPLADLRVSAPAAEAWTDAGGAFEVAASPGDPIVAMLVGRAAVVTSAAGAELQASAPAGTELALELADGGGEAELAQTTAFQVATAARRWLVDGGAAEADLGAAVRVHVNEDDTCNAFYSPEQRSLHFFRAGGSCRNSAEPSIIAHEYGHFVDDAHGGITDDGLSEGWGDLLACFLLRDPVIGADLFPSGRLRSCANQYRYPRSGMDEEHDLGQAWAGFAWDLRTALIERLGPEAGEARARALIMPVLLGNAADIPAAVRQVFLLDDDDGDLDNGTPSWELLALAAGRHDLGFVIGEEAGPPAAVDDLEVVAATATRVTLRWKAPGDDGNRGTAARYELRWAERPISSADFATATLVPLPAPRPAGTVEEATIAVPPADRVWFALMAWDDAGAASPLSSVAVAKLGRPALVFADGAEGGMAGWHATGLWNVTGRAAAEGARSFWYGIEAQGDYDTGAPTVGALVSPLIDLTGVVAPVLVFSERVDVEDDPEHDRLTVTAVDVEDHVVMVSLAKETGWTDGQFRRRLLDLAPLAGRVVRIEIVFDSVDGKDNRRGGWFVDALQVVADEAPPARGALVINEVLADPPEGFDAAGDGTWSYRDDEMIELVNAGDQAIDLGGVTIEDGVGPRFTFPEGTSLAPGRALVVFGGGTPVLAGVMALAAPGGLQLNNDGDRIRVRATGGEVLAELAYGADGGKDQSLVRAVDGDPEAPMVLHRTLAAAPASPGRRSDGSAF